MSTENPLVRDYLRLSSIFVYESDNMFNALEALKKFNVEKLTVVKEDFSVVGFIDKKTILEIIVLNRNNGITALKDMSVKDSIQKSEFPVVLYPRMSIKDAYTTMKCLNVKGLPVVDVPWEKRVIGYLWFNDISTLVENSYKKVSV